MNVITDDPIISFQASIDLVIGYDPPANFAPNPNDSQEGDSTVDAGVLFLV